MKGALVIGIDDYPGDLRLHGCVNDAKMITALLKTNANGTDNFDVKLKTDVASRSQLRAMIIRLFDTSLDVALFYFAGHGYLNERGGFIVTPDFRLYDEGISMDEILAIVNQSKIKNKIIIVDCCCSGAMGNPVIVGGTTAILADGVTIMASCRRSESAMEEDENGVFTNLLLDALEGGAADIAGRITPGGVYAFVDRSMGFWQQRPMFKNNVNRFLTLRKVKPLIAPAVLKKITEYFETPEMNFHLDPTYEFTNKGICIRKNVVKLRNLQKMTKVGLVTPVGEEHMYFAAMNSKSCKLTALGRHYWKLIRNDSLKEE